MRRARQRDDSRETVYLLSNRVCGIDGERVFGKREKNMLRKLIRRLARFYVVSPVMCGITGDGFRIVCNVPAALPDRKQVLRRFVDYYGNKKAPPDEENYAAINALARRMRDISCFMKDLQQIFAVWYNRTRRPRRHGPVWRDRFSSVILCTALRVWRGLLAAQFAGTVRPGDVKNPAPASFHRIKLARGHPFKAKVQKVLDRHPRLREILDLGSDILRDASLEAIDAILRPGTIRWG